MTTDCQILHANTNTYTHAHAHAHTHTRTRTRTHTHTHNIPNIYRARNTYKYDLMRFTI